MAAFLANAAPPAASRPPCYVRANETCLSAVQRVSRNVCSRGSSSLAAQRLASSSFHGSSNANWRWRPAAIRTAVDAADVRRRAGVLSISASGDAPTEVISEDDVAAEEKRVVFTWDDVMQLARDLVLKLKDSLHGNSARRTYDVLLAITRGGMVPGCLVSEALELRQCLTASVMFYTGNAAGLTLETPAFLQFPNDSIFEGKKVLLVDDCWDTGSTIMAVRDRLLRAGAVSVTIAVLHYKSTESKFPDARPDYYAVETDATWLVYPWENEASGLGKIG